MSEQIQLIAQPTPVASASSIPDHLLHKNRLQEYTQRASIPLPVYQTVNEGYQHAPKFRSTVWVDGALYKSSTTYPHRKSAEQDVAKLALECIPKKIKDEGCPLIRGDTVFCKSILNEFAVKANIEMPVYHTVQSEGLLPVFVSSLVFNGVTCTGEAGRTKKEAEQLTARRVIQSILDTGTGTLLTEIIKSKGKLYAALRNAVPEGVNDPYNVQNSVAPVGAYTCSTPEVSVSKGKEVTSADTGNIPSTVALDASPAQVNNVVPVMPPAPHALMTPKVEPSFDASPPRVLEPTMGSGPSPNSVAPILVAGPSSYGAGPSSFAVSPTPVASGPSPFGSVPSSFYPVPSTGKKRNRRNKKKSQKKQRIGEPLPLIVAPNVPEPLNASAPEHLNASAPEPLNASAPEPLSVSAPEPLNVVPPLPLKEESSSAPEHLNASAPEHLNASAPEPPSASAPEPPSASAPEPLNVVPPLPLKEEPSCSVVQ